MENLADRLNYIFDDDIAPDGEHKEKAILTYKILQARKKNRESENVGGDWTDE